MTFAKLAFYFARLEKTSSRNKMTEFLAQLFKKAGREEIDKVCYLALGRLAPLYAGVEFNLAEKMMVRVLAKAYGQEEKKIRQKYQSLGDLGDTAAFFDKKTKTKPLSVAAVYRRLEEVAVEAGAGSVERKIQKMARLLDDLDGQSAKYLVRIPLGKLRLGFSDKTILDALSWMIVGDKSKRTAIEEAYNVRADVGQIAKKLKTQNSKELKKIKPQVGIPIMPALCQRLPNPEKMIEKMGKVAAEPKFDGTRLQIHFRKRHPQGEQRRHPGGVNIFTRNLENVTPMFPDIVKAVFAQVKARQAILDGEGIGFDPKTGKFLPFQETIKRKRKYQVGAKAKEIPLKYFVFDLLYKDGQSLLEKPFSFRRAVLAKTISGMGKTIVLSPQTITDSVAELRRYHDEQIKKGLEGAVVKKWQAPYDPGRRGYTWVKFKQEEGKKGGGLADTLDCVVMGYYRGRGKRVTFGIGGFLVGVRKGSKFLTISKIGTGLSDDQWRKMCRRCESVRTAKPPKQYQVDKNLFPDVWCVPEIVVEIEADNITQSPIHTADFALRFPRLVRFRDDKSPHQATTLTEAIKLYQLQK